VRSNGWQGRASTATRWAVAQHVGGDGMPRIHVENDDEVGHADFDAAGALEGQELVLKIDARARARMRIDALELERAHRKATAQMALQIDDLGVDQVNAVLLGADFRNAERCARLASSTRWPKRID